MCSDGLFHKKIFIIMKKVYMMLAAAAITAMAACSTKSVEKAEEVNAMEIETVENADVTAMPVSTDGTVITPAKASLFAPGMKTTQLMVLDFNAVWCGPCRRLAPVMEEMAKKYAGKATFVSIDVDDFPELAQAWGNITSVPTVIFVKPDGTTSTYVGTGDLLPAENIDAIIAANL